MCDFKLIDTNPRVEVQESEYARLLGYPRGRTMEGRSRELADQARQWYTENGRPWLVARAAGPVVLDRSALKIGPAEFHSQRLFETFAAAEAHCVVVLAVSAGPECEEKARELWRDEKPDEYFFLESFGSAVVEQLVAIANGRICGWAESLGMAALPHYSPGYSGWNVSEQSQLEALIRWDHRGLPTSGLEVLASGMLRPKKSLLAAIGITRHADRFRAVGDLVPCRNCSLLRCEYRRIPYLRPMPQLEDVRQLQGGPSPKGTVPAVRYLTRNAKYSISEKALSKWSRERLELKLRTGGDWEARFRYEGTTCSNLGRPLEFVYRIALSPATDGYRIIEAECAPAADDTGHKCQCEYLKDATGLMNGIAREKPLLGRPLEEVLNWERPYDPSGCFCDQARRDHKWGLVYEVVHFALAQRETRHDHGDSASMANESDDQTVRH